MNITKGNEVISLGLSLSLSGKGREKVRLMVTSSRTLSLCDLTWLPLNRMRRLSLVSFLEGVYLLEECRGTIGTARELHW